MQLAVSKKSISISEMQLIEKDFFVGSDLSMTCFILIRMLDGKEQFLFKAFDVATFLKYKQPRNAIYDHVPKEWKMSWGELTAGISFPQVNWSSNTIFLTEAGLYSLIVRSKLPQAVAFQKWLFEDVLPSLRGQIIRKLNVLPTQIDKHQSIVENFNKGYVYIAATKKMANRNVYKIGCTMNLKNRMNQLSHANYSKKYKLYYVIKCKDKFKYEKFVHTILKEYRIRNEFFRLPRNKFMFIIKNLILRLKKQQIK